jgi:hypothetical protein
VHPTSSSRHGPKQPVEQPVRLRDLAALARRRCEGRPVARELAGNSYQTIWCEDWKWRVDGYLELRAYHDQAAALAPHTKLSPFWNDVATCLGWPAEVSNPQHRLAISNAPKILVMTSAADVGAPRAWNVAVSQQISNSVLLNYDGVGHGQYTLSSCVRAYFTRYLIDLATPAPGTHCAAEYPAAPPASAVSAQCSLI